MSDREILETVQGLGALAKEVEMLREQVKDLKQDRDSWRRLAERYETNCTGRHGSQASCGSQFDAGEKPA